MREWAAGVERVAPGSCRVYAPPPHEVAAVAGSGEGGCGEGGGQKKKDAKNPYVDVLVGSHVLAVTADSVTMASEACGVPLHVCACERRRERARD